MQLFLCTWDYQTGQDRSLPAPQDLVKKSPMFCSVFRWNWMIPKAMHCQRLGLVAFHDWHSQMAEMFFQRGFSLIASVEGRPEQVFWESKPESYSLNYTSKASFLPTKPQCVSCKPGNQSGWMCHLKPNSLHTVPHVGPGLIGWVPWTGAAQPQPSQDLGLNSLVGKHLVSLHSWCQISYYWVHVNPPELFFTSIPCLVLLCSCVWSRAMQGS